MSDKDLLKNRFAANLRSYNSLAVVQERICEELAELIGTHVPGKITRGLEVGTGTGFLTRRLLERYPDAEWTLNDLVEASECFLQPYVGGRKTQCYWGDAESLPAFGRPFDLIATASTVQWFDNLPAFLNRTQEMLAAGGRIGAQHLRPRQLRRDPGDDRGRPRLLHLCGTGRFTETGRIDNRRTKGVRTPPGVRLPDRRTAAHQGDRGKRNPQNPLDPATADRFRNALPQPVFDFFRHSDTYLSPDPDRGEKIETLREQAEAPGTKTYTSNRS